VAITEHLGQIGHYIGDHALPSTLLSEYGWPTGYDIEGSDVILTEVRERMETALRGNMDGLHDLVAEWRREGKSQLEVYEVFVSFMLALRSEEREVDEDLVTDVLEFIYGWCSPGARWFEHSLTEDDLQQYRQTREQSSK
jgi:hypothetical protein